jgi:biotin carboxyl carrier protein
MYKAKIAEKEFDISFENGDFILNGKKGSWDIRKIRDNHYHLIHDHKSYSIEVVKADKATKHFTLKVNNKPVDISVQDRYDQLLQKMGMDTLQSTKVNDIIAPMPGMVLKVVVNEGQEIKKGESILILEAMKMENILKSPGDGKIKSLKVKAGDKVEKNQVLVVME